jgi:hypothetical protein
MDERARRLAENETVFRAGNEAINANLKDGHELTYLCECGSDTCFERVPLTRAEYEAVRANPARFMVVPGHHDAAAGEVVVSQSDRYAVVEKRLEARAIAEQTDPRAQR